MIDRISYDIKQCILHTYTCSFFSRRRCINHIKTISNFEEDFFDGFSTNDIKIFRIEGKKYYFRECRRHARFSQYLKGGIKAFAENNNIESDIIRAIIPDRGLAYFLLCNMGTRSYKKSRLNNATNNNNYELIGIDSIIAVKNKTIVDRLVFYISSLIENYKLNGSTKMGEIETFGSSRSVATRIVSEILGIEELIPDIRYVKLEYLRREVVGTLSDNCEGESPYNRDIHVYDISGSFQRDINNMELIDVICFQKDHGRQNYNVIQSGNIGVRLKVFDNDAPSSFFPTFLISFHSYDGCSEYVTKTGLINRPYMDYDVVKKIESIKYDEWKEKLQGHLSKVEILYSYRRIERIKRAIKKSLKEKKVELVKQHMWNDKTIKKETSGEYGETALCDFCDYMKEIKHI